MKHLLSVLVIIFFYNVSYSQYDAGDQKTLITPRDTLVSLVKPFTSEKEVLIPFRKGSKWGMADTLRNLIIPAIYDEIETNSSTFSSGHSYKSCNCVPATKHHIYGYYVVISNGKYGVVNRNGVILPPKHDRLTFVNEFFILEHNDPGKLFNLKGQLLSDSIAEIEELHYDTGLKDHYLFEATGRGINGIFLFDAKTQKIIKWIIRDNFYYMTVSCGQEKNVSIFFTPKSNNMLFYHFHFDSKTMKANLKSIDLKKSDSIIGANKFVYIDSYKAYEYLNPTDTLLSISYSLSLVNNELLLSSNTNTFYSNCNIRHKDTIRLAVQYDDVKINHFRFNNYETTRTNHRGIDSIFYYQNYITYSLNGKHGAIAESTVIPPIYDSISLVSDRNCKPLFLASLQSDKGKLRWGIIESTGRIVIPFEYDELKVFGSSVVTKKDSLYGIMTYTGELIAPPKYERVTSKGSYRLPYLDIYSSSLYGIYNTRELIEPFSPKKIIAMFDIEIGKYHIYKISDEENNAVGYRTKTGINFFEE